MNYPLTLAFWLSFVLVVRILAVSPDHYQRLPLSVALPLVDKATPRLGRQIWTRHGQGEPVPVSGGLDDWIQQMALSNQPLVATQIEIAGAPLEMDPPSIYPVSFQGQPLVLDCNDIFQTMIVHRRGQAGSEAARAMGELLLREFLEHHPWRGLLLVPQDDSYRALVRPQQTKPLFPDTVYEQLDQALLSFSSHREALAQMGVPSKRGILLVGPPGTGKTSLMRWLMTQLPQYTTLMIQSESPEQVRGVFQLARLLSPSLILIEDVDLLATNRYHNSLALFLGALMNELDGVQINEDVLVVMSSNDITEMDAAMIRRPGRIDRLISIPTPGTPLRLQILEQALQRLPRELAENDLPDLASQTEGLSPAALHEIVKQAALRAIQRSPEDPRVVGDDLQVARTLFLSSV